MYILRGFRSACIFEHSLCAFWIDKESKFPYAENEDSDDTAQSDSSGRSWYMLEGNSSCRSIIERFNHDLTTKAHLEMFSHICSSSRPRWLIWMRRPTGDQEVAGSTPAEVGNILSWRLIMKYFLRSFSSFSWFKKGSCQFLAKECTQYWLTA